MNVVIELECTLLPEMCFYTSNIIATLIHTVWSRQLHGNMDIYFFKLFTYNGEIKAQISITENNYEPNKLL